MEQIQGSVGLSQDKIQSTGLSPKTGREVVVTTVGLNTVPRDALLMVRSAFTTKRRTIFPICAEVVNVAKAVEAIDLKVKTTDSVKKTNMRWKPMTLMMTASGILMNKNLCIQFTTKHLYCTKQTNVVFDEIDNENMPRVLADLQVARCNGPHDSLHVHDVFTKCFKIDSGACGNLIPLSLYLELYPESNVNDLKSTIDHRVQLVAYNKNLIKQHGTCYLKVRFNNRVHICKFYVVDSHFNPIIGVGSCIKLGLITFQSPIYTGWNNGRPVSIGVHAVD